MKQKFCPLLAYSSTQLSLTVEGESYTNTQFSRCLEDKCAAYHAGRCMKFEPWREEMVSEADCTKAQTLIEAEREGRLALLPCKVGSRVYVIREALLSCDKCPHRSEARYVPDINCQACDLSNGKHCPIFIEEKVAEGFEVMCGEDGKIYVKGPGEWSYEGLMPYESYNGEIYYTEDAAKEALKGVLKEVREMRQSGKTEAQ